ncbi:MAG: 3-hydroxyacyl-CoA dehydrogenase family protein [Candidatus Humimicrobiaceae bacterium]
MKLDSVKHIGIIGTGMIGSSLAVLFTGNGYRTTMHAINDQETAAGMERYHTYYKDLIAKKLVTPKQAESCANLVSVTQNFEDLWDVDFILECVVERLEVKHSVYAEIEKHCKQFKAIASSTSAISVEDLAKGLTHKEKLSVAHPWNPPHLVPCVEVVKSQFTSDEAVKVVVDTLESVGREVVVMRKGAPGFIGNRLQHALYREAVYMVEQGIATPQDIDRTLRTSFIPRYTSIGLFEHHDYAGLDMVLSIEDYLFPSLCNADKAQNLIRNLNDAGDLGFKTGKGVLDWSGVDIDKFRQRASEPYLHFFNWSLPKE